MFTIIRTSKLRALLDENDSYKKAVRFAAKVREQKTKGATIVAIAPVAPKKKIDDLIMLVMADGKPRGVDSVIRGVKRTGLCEKRVLPQSVGKRLSFLKATGKLSRLSRGIYQLTTTKGE